MRDFKSFSDVVEKNLNNMSGGTLFKVDDPEDLIWKTYLDSFPEGQNPIVVERTEHDCSCCKNFVRNLGKVISIENGVITSVWDGWDFPYPYDVVAEKVAEKVRSMKISSVFFSKQKQYGVKKTNTLIEGEVRVNNHFFGVLDNKYVSESPEEKSGFLNTSAQVLQRSLDELSINAVNDVLELIDDKDVKLYRGDEFKNAVMEFKKILSLYNKPSNGDKSLFAWEYCGSQSARFKNSVIGTLVSDLSSGMDVNKAVRSFESKVAPQNYKRSKSLITKQMTENAVKKIDELGIRDSLERRFATISDVSINNVLFADRSAQPLMKDSLMDSLMAEVVEKSVDEDKATNISVSDFMARVAPKTKSMEILVKNANKKNFFSLTAPVNESSKNIFKWDNKFSWAYSGDVADSDIKTKVSNAGGNVTAPFRVSLAWYNYDDLDIHVVEPNGNTIWYSNKRSSTGGFLDVDMNVSANSREAVENICWNNPIDGSYKIKVNNYTKRESIDVGFELEVENNGNISNYIYQKPVSGNKLYLTIEVKNGQIQNVVCNKDVESRTSSQNHWGVKTEVFSKVKTLMNSPNHWDGNETGNKHYFFVLEDCINPDRVRGFFNENLINDLSEHRKTLEILGAKTRCEESENQLSGVGFSSTRKEEVIIRVDSSRLYNVKF